MRTLPPHLVPSTISRRPLAPNLVVTHSATPPFTVTRASTKALLTRSLPRFARRIRSPAPRKTPHRLPFIPPQYTVAFRSGSPQPHLQSQSHRSQEGHSHNPHHHYLSLAFYLAPIYVTAACLAFIYYESTFHEELLQPEEEFDEMEILPGRPGNLTPEQDEKLRQLWAAIFRLCHVASEADLAAAMTDASLSPTTVSPRATLSPESAEKEKDKPKKKRMGIFSRNKNASSKDVSSATTDETQVVSPSVASAGGTSAPVSGRVTPLPPGADVEDKYGQTKHFLETLEKQSPESIRSTIWSMVKHDHPDALVLRFLRARKWDVDKALVMLISTMNWRHETMKVDEVIMKEGELVPAEQEKADDIPVAQRTLARDFLAQIRMGKSFIHGVDRHGRPICVVRVRYHRAGEQCEESLERYTVYLIETARMLLTPPVDTATVVFDMTNFSMANMDYAPVKFMIKCFEANYPESLGAVLVHKAPWIFQGIWKIIRGWLDPVVASKVHFTNNAKDVEEFIPPEHILKELDGPEDWSYSYVEPVLGENDRMKDVVTRDRLLKQREEQVKEYEQLTIKWIGNPGDEGVRKQRAEMAEKIRKGYWELDPFLRARSLYDRLGMLEEGGKVVPYPSEGGKGALVAGKKAEEKIEEKVNGEKVKRQEMVAIPADADDVD